MTMMMSAPFPWFGGKRKVAEEVWRRFGRVANYVEPFFGSGAVLLGRPDPVGVETVNDKDGLIANAWRALRDAPDDVAAWCDWPVNENDLHARHAWLVERRAVLTAQLEGDPEYYDARIAGYWIWGIACWIGGGWCSGDGPWQVDGHRQLVHLGDAGQGVQRRRVHLGTAGRGVHRKRVHLGDAGQGQGLRAWFTAIATRMRFVRVCSGDWSRVLGPSVTVCHGVTGVFLDPPYADTAERSPGLYAEDCLRVAHDVREWCVSHGDDPMLRIALCGYEGEHVMPTSWDCHGWNAGAGYSGRSAQSERNGRRERVWFSPHCQGQRLF